MPEPRTHYGHTADCFDLAAEDHIEAGLDHHIVVDLTVQALRSGQTECVCDLDAVSATSAAAAAAENAAYTLGQAAYARPGALAVPAADPALAPLLAGLPVGGGALAIMGAWNRGWHAAADAAARAALAEM